MGRVLGIIGIGLIAALGSFPAAAKNAGDTVPPATAADKSGGQVEVTADQSLEWYQDAHIYVARGHARAVRGDMVVDADLLTAHEREPPPAPPGPDGKPAPKPPKPAKGQGGGSSGSGDLDKMTAEGHVVITDPRERILGDKAVDDLDRHVSVITGGNLRYETEKDTVTAKDSLEYWEDKKLAIARGNAVAVSSDRHVEGDVLEAEFREAPNNTQELWKMTATGHVVVITKGDVSRGNKAVYDVNRNIAILTGNVRITRTDGTQLTGDVGEVDFKTNQSRLLNSGHGRVRALLSTKTTSGAGGADGSAKPKTKPGVASSTGVNQ